MAAKVALTANLFFCRISINSYATQAGHSSQIKFLYNESFSDMNKHGVIDNKDDLVAVITNFFCMRSPTVDLLTDREYL